METTVTNKEKTMATKIEMIDAIRLGLQAPTTGPRCGCGRAYIVLSSKADKKTLKDFKDAVETCGLRFLGNAYGVSGKRTVYVGYDNGTGHPLAQAEAIAKNLRNIGVDVFDDAVGD